VDAVLADERLIAARALWKPEGLRAVYLAFAEAHAIGLSSIGGLLQPVPRNAPGGLAVHLAPEPARRQRIVLAPIAPGMVRAIGVEHVEAMPPGQDACTSACAPMPFPPSTWAAACTKPPCVACCAARPEAFFHHPKETYHA